MEYQFKDGFHTPPGASATAVVDALEDIRSRYGSLTTDNIADDVEQDDVSHPLRQWFTWDEELGMRKLHTIEASLIIRSVAVVKITKEQPAPVRAYVFVGTGGDTRYEPLTVVLAQPDQRRQLIETIASEKRAVDRKFEELLALVTTL